MLYLVRRAQLLQPRAQRLACGGQRGGELGPARHLAVGAQCRREVHAAELCAAALDQPVHGRRRRCERLPRLRVTRLVLGRIGAQLPQNLG
jgi:hypothetical protein